MKKALAALAIVIAFGIGFATSASAKESISDRCAGCLAVCASLHYDEIQCAQICGDVCAWG